MNLHEYFRQAGELDHEIDFHPSDEAESIIGKPPSWTLRWGSTCIFILLALILWSAYLIKYPDIVRANIKISSTISPTVVFAKKDGMLKKIFVADNDTVKKGQALGFVESLADPQKVLAMSIRVDYLIDLINSNAGDSIPLYFPLSYTSLGELQYDYKSLTQEFLRYRSFINTGYQRKKQLLLKEDMESLNKINRNLIIQKALVEKDLEIEAEKMNISNILIKEKVISKVELKDQESRYLSKQIPVQQMNSNLITNTFQIREKEKEIMEVNNNISEQQSIFLQALITFKSKLQDWLDLHILVAPEAGIVSINTILQENQHLTFGQEVFNILPFNAEYRAIGYLSQFNFGKIKHQQQVVLKLSSYPYQEYGLLNGTILSVSNTPKDSGYLVLIRLNSDLHQGTRSKIVLKEGLTGTAEVITDDKRLIQKFSSLFNIFRN